MFNSGVSSLTMDGLKFLQDDVPIVTGRKDLLTHTKSVVHGEHDIVKTRYYCTRRAMGLAKLFARLHSDFHLADHCTALNGKVFHQGDRSPFTSKCYPCFH